MMKDLRAGKEKKFRFLMSALSAKVCGASDFFPQATGDTLNCCCELLFLKGVLCRGGGSGVYFRPLQ